MATSSLLGTLSEELSSLAAGAGDRVVQVGAGRGRPATGTVFAPDLVLTASHGIEPGGGWEVRDAAGAARSGEHLGADPATGLAVLRVPGLDAKPLEPSRDVRVGQIAMALGRTWSGALAVSAGLISVIGGPLRTGRGRSVEQVVRADVRVHPLGAGGPLIDAAGRFVGIATGAFMRGTPLFIPSDIARRTGESIVEHGGVRRGYLGVSAQPVRLPAGQRPDSAQELGLLVVAVADDSPARRAGVLIGDVLVGFDGQPVAEHDALLSLLTADRVGKACALQVIRGGELRIVEVTVGTRQ